MTINKISSTIHNGNESESDFNCSMLRSLSSESDEDFDLAELGETEEK